jgi:hypothetical protein
MISYCSVFLLLGIYFSTLKGYLPALAVSFLLSFGSNFPEAKFTIIPHTDIR